MRASALRYFSPASSRLAGSYALYTVFDNAWIAAALGLFWGLMIFNLDRYIVSSMRKEGSIARELFTASPRIILAVLISLVIAKPLEMKIFEKEIESELVIMEQQTYTEQENEIRTRFQPDQDRLKSEITLLKNEILGQTKSRDELDRIAREEADGTGGSKRVNAGPIYKIKKADAARANLELEQLIAKNDPLIQNKLAGIEKNDSALAVALTSLVHQKIDGPAMRMEALSRLIVESDAIWWSNFFIVLLFIAVETAPVFVKLISPSGPYDHLLKIEEQTFEGQRIESLARINAEIKNRTKDLPGNEAEFVNDRLKVMLDKS